MSDIVERLKRTAAGMGVRDPAKYMARLTVADALAAASEIERLRAALDNLLCEAEDIFNCMADATGIDRHNYPPALLVARAALETGK